jgi:hypothetical protein
MKLTIGNKYQIISDPYNFVLYKYDTIINKKDKSERMDWKIIGFYPRIDHALNKILQEDISDLDESNIHMILDQIKQSEKVISKAVVEYQLKKDRVREEKEKGEIEDEN